MFIQLCLWLEIALKGGLKGVLTQVNEGRVQGRLFGVTQVNKGRVQGK